MRISKAHPIHGDHTVKALGKVPQVGVKQGQARSKAMGDKASGRRGAGVLLVLGTSIFNGVHGQCFFSAAEGFGEGRWQVYSFSLVQRGEVVVGEQSFLRLKELCIGRWNPEFSQHDQLLLFKSRSSSV